MRTQSPQAHLLALSATVGAALAGDDALRTILQRCAEALVQHLGVMAAYIWTLDTDGKILEMQASVGMYTPLGDVQGSIRVGESVIGRIAQDRQPYVTSAVSNDEQVVDTAWAIRPMTASQ